MATQQLATGQLVMDGMEVDPYQNMELKDMAALILDQYPDAKDHDMVFVLRCLWEFDGLHKVIDAGTYRKLLAWAERHKGNRFETWRRRRQEIQRNRSQNSGYLKPSERVEHYRRRRDGAGAPRG